MYGNANNYANHADAMVNSSPALPDRLSLAQAVGNPNFVAQFDLTILKKYFTAVTATGVYTEIAPAAVNAGIRTSLPAFIFGNADFHGGFKKISAQFPINSGWVMGTPFIYGQAANDILPVLDVTVTATLVKGDLVIPYISALPGAGTTTLALVIVRCDQNAYGTLLDALNSDVFDINMIRYIIPDANQVAQYGQQVGVFDLSIFGKFESDNVSSNGFKNPMQQQNNIVDVPVEKGIDKQVSMGFYTIYTCVEIQWSIYVASVRKIRAVM
jgi:hypothetical protein